MSYSRWGSSDWYIFNECSDATKIEDELLAIWHVGDKDHQSYDYITVKEVYKSKDWSKLNHKELTQLDILEDCVECFLCDMEVDYADVIHNRIDDIDLEKLADELKQKFIWPAKWHIIRAWMVSKKGIDATVTNDVINIMEELGILIRFELPETMFLTYKVK